MDELGRDKALQKLASKLEIREADKMKESEKVFVADLRLNVSMKQAIKSDAFGPGPTKNILQHIQKYGLPSKTGTKLRCAIQKNFGNNCSERCVKRDKEGNLKAFLLDYAVENICDGMMCFAFATFEWNFGRLKAPRKVFRFNVPWFKRDLSVKEHELIKKWCGERLYDSVSQKCKMHLVDETRL